MALFVDTSALIALLDARDPRHGQVRAEWARFATSGERLVTSNYVVVETVAVLQRKLGIPAARDLLDEVLPLVDVHWIDEPIHDAAVRALRLAGRRALSLVDLSSFELMRALDARVALAIDPHFAEQGFETVPARDVVHEPAAAYDAAQGTTPGKIGAEARHESEATSVRARRARPRRRLR